MLRRIILFLLVLPALAFAQMTPPPVAARAWLLLDVGSGQVLTAEQPDQRIEPASLTKLMTAYLAFSAVKNKTLALDQTIPVSPKAWKVPGSKMFIEPQTPVTVKELLHGMIIQSGNDACVALAEAIAGSEEAFAQLMNKEAARLGLKNTHFENATGLPHPSHLTTVRDLSVLAAAIIHDFPEFYPIYSTRKYRFEGAPASNENNRNVLLQRDPTVDGMKTGYTEAAGYCLIASAQRDFPNGKRRLISVVLNTTSMDARANESQKLLNWGYAAWDAVRLFEPGKAIATPQVWKGKLNEAKLGVEAGVFVTVPKGEGSKLVTRIERTDPLVAPLAKGQKVGVLKVATPAGLAVAEVPLVVLEAVDEAGIFGRAWDAIRLWIK